jgi:hypothetical protein
LVWNKERRAIRQQVGRPAKKITHLRPPEI